MAYYLGEEINLSSLQFKVINFLNEQYKAGKKSFITQDQIKKMIGWEEGSYDGQISHLFKSKSIERKLLSKQGQRGCYRLILCEDDSDL